LAVILATLIDKVPDWLSNILRAGFFMPAVTSVVVITYIWKQLLSTDYGVLNGLLTSVGLPAQNFLGDANISIWSIIVMLIWAGLGWDALIVTSALRAIPEEYYEAAKLDGANGLNEFFSITLPLLRPTLLFLVTTGLIYLLGLFSQVQLMTGGNPAHKTETLALYLYDTAFGRQEFGYASALAVTLTTIMFIASYINFRFFGSDGEI
jgi:ABC-type sugar transport system permease subunit